MKRLFVGRIDRGTRTRDLEDLFEPYGKLTRCEIKQGNGPDSAYAFIDFDNDRDAEDAMRGEHGRKLHGSTIVVEWAKGKSRRPMGGMGGGNYASSRDECYRCGRRGHYGRDCNQGFRQTGRGRSPPDYRSYNRRRSRYSRSRSRSYSRGRSRSRSRSPQPSHSRSPPKYSRSPRRSPSIGKNRSVSRSRSKS